MSIDDNYPVFTKVANAKPIVYSSRIPIGIHQAELRAVRVKASERLGPILEAEFALVTSHPPVADRLSSWAWFVGSPGYAGQFEQARAKEFAEALHGAQAGTQIYHTVEETLQAATKGELVVGQPLIARVAETGKTNARGVRLVRPTWHFTPEHPSAWFVRHAEHVAIEELEPLFVVLEARALGSTNEDDSAIWMSAARSVHTLIVNAGSQSDVSSRHGETFAMALEMHKNET